MSKANKIIGFLFIIFGIGGFWVIEPKEGFEILNRLCLVMIILAGIKYLLIKEK